MIKAFFDESYNSNEPRMFAVAGIVAQDTVCNQIEAEWKAVLDEKNKELATQGRRQISRYHAAEMNAHSNEFGGWNKEETLQFTEKLLAVLHGRDIFILSFAIILDDMVKVFPEWLEELKDPRACAYRHAFHQCLLISGRLIANPAHIRPGQNLEVWHDQCDWNVLAADVYAQLKSDKGFSERDRLVKCRHACSRSQVCLQPADMMAYECWRESERFVCEKESNMRPFFARLVNAEQHRVSATYADERYFREVRDNWEERTKR